MTIFLIYPHMIERGLWSPSFHKNNNTTMGASVRIPHLNIITSQKPSLQMQITLEILATAYESQGDRNWKFLIFLITSQSMRLKKHEAVRQMWLAHKCNKDAALAVQIICLFFWNWGADEYADMAVIVKQTETVAKNYTSRVFSIQFLRKIMQILQFIFCWALL